MPKPIPFAVPDDAQLAYIERITPDGEKLPCRLRGWVVDPAEYGDPTQLFCAGDGPAGTATCDNQPGLVEVIRLRVFHDVFCEVIWCKRHGMIGMEVLDFIDHDAAGKPDPGIAGPPTGHSRQEP